MERDAARRPLVRASWLLTGVAMMLGFFSLERTSNTIEVAFIPPWDASTRGELYFWLGAVMLLLPGSALVAASFAESMRATGNQLRHTLDNFDARERKIALVALASVAWAIARLGNQLALHGEPFTDDEEAARFGGQVLAQGLLMAPLPPLRFAFVDVFLYQRDGRWTSFDFLGALLPWTTSELTGSGTLVFAVFAALAPCGVALAVMRRHGAAAGLGAGLLTIASPMACTLSFTSHTHLVSRGLLALGLGVILFVERVSFRRGAVSGFLLGCALLTRPAEVGLLVAPVVFGFAWEAIRVPEARPRLYGLASFALPALLLMVTYNFAVSGTFGFPRAAANNEIQAAYSGIASGPFAFERWPGRFGNNLSYNFLTLSIWFLGPLGLPLAWLGARTTALHRRLGAGVLMSLALCLLHDDRGLHMVGPIHLSETAVPLIILTMAGLARVRSVLELSTVWKEVFAAGLLGYAAIGLPTFALWHTGALGKQAINHGELVASAERVERTPAAVLVPPLEHARKFAQYASTGSFLFHWRRARPDLSEPVLILMDSTAARSQVADAFPSRTAYVYDPQRYGPSPVPLNVATAKDTSTSTERQP
jgi:hypothetical protein